MLYGYVMAVLAGFLFTAVRNWTGRPTPTGATLAGFAALWVAGRVLVMTPYELAAAWVNAAFPVAVSITGLLTACAKRGSAFANTVMPSQVPRCWGLAEIADSLSAHHLVRCGQKWLVKVKPFFTERERPQAGAW